MSSGKNPRIVLTAGAAVCALGHGRRELAQALRSQRSGLKPCAYEDVRLETYVGEVTGVDKVEIPPTLAQYESRSARLLELALHQDEFLTAVERAKRRYGAARIGVFAGTTSSGMTEIEAAYRRRASDGALPRSVDYSATLNFYAPADYLRRRLALKGPAATVACACASSAKAFASARRLIRAGIIDAALVGGVESLCQTTLYGFHSLQICSSTPCRPFDRRRDGLSLGEAAALVLMEKADHREFADAVLLLGIGESSDAFNLTAPEPNGRGAEQAMRLALSDAHLVPCDIDYINLHGTGTPSNDRAEGRAVARVFGAATACSSTKSLTGHTLGAAGALECIFGMIALQENLLPGGDPSMQMDPELKVSYVRQTRPRSTRYIQSNSFGFGGSNCSLILGALHSPTQAP